MPLNRLFYICLICASMMMVGLNKSWNAYSEIEPKSESIQNQASENENAPEVTRYYVARSGDGSDGSSWEKAYQNVQTAILNAVSNGGGEIWVAKGVYYPDEGTGQINDVVTSTFVLTDSVALYGGFDTDDMVFSDRDWENNLTVLSGDVDGDDFTNVDGVVVDTDNINGKNAYHVVTATNVDNSAIIDGFVITGGNAESSPYHTEGGGLYCNATGSGKPSDPIKTCDPMIKNILFSGNYAQGGGGAIKLLGYLGGTSNPTIENVTFSSNSADVGGGVVVQGIQCWGNYSPILSNVIFHNNSAVWGGAMFIYSDLDCTLSPSITNAVFSGNYASDYGGALVNWSNDNNGKSNPTFTNVTFSGNRAGNNGGAIYNNSQNESESKPQIRNSVIWNNMDISGTETISSSIYQMRNNSKTYILNSIVQGAGNSGNASWIDDERIVDGGGNIDANPLFITPIAPANAPTSDGNLRLSENSPAIDMGDNAYISEMYDLDGKTRKVDGDGNGTAIVDMGAYESEPAYLLTVNKSGNGSGSVNSSPANIDCGNICSAYFGKGTTVKLEESPDTGSQFTGWGGDCSGKGDCEVPMTKNKNVTATFDLALGTYLPLVKR